MQLERVGIVLMAPENMAAGDDVQQNLIHIQRGGAAVPSRAFQVKFQFVSRHDRIMLIKG